jgi:hypothetical protein
MTARVHGTKGRHGVSGDNLAREYANGWAQRPTPDLWSRVLHGGRAKAAAAKRSN